MPLDGEYAPSPATWARRQAELYEATGGREGSTMLGRPIVVVTSRGAKSGKLRKTPLMRVEHDGAYLAVASMGGSAEDPVWVHNLRASPRAELQDGPERWDVVARELAGDERVTWWERAVGAFPNYARYQDRTDRLIPLFLLERAEE